KNGARRGGARQRDERVPEGLGGRVDARLVPLSGVRQQGEGDRAQAPALGPGGRDLRPGGFVPVYAPVARDLSRGAEQGERQLFPVLDQFVLRRMLQQDGRAARRGERRLDLGDVEAERTVGGDGETQQTCVRIDCSTR
ncbi:MAG: hypothetical protein ACRDP3_00220, partial [Streptomyces sp.]|uniref:hypothetical protein n=1 Tax=Streptomyces sp. TaxID=1931 RepID=UPI003D6A58A8